MAFIDIFGLDPMAVGGMFAAQARKTIQLSFNGR